MPPKLEHATFSSVVERSAIQLHRLFVQFWNSILRHHEPLSRALAFQATLQEPKKSHFAVHPPPLI